MSALVSVDALHKESVISVIGAFVDVQLEEGLAEIRNAMVGKPKHILEVTQNMGENTV